MQTTEALLIGTREAAALLGVNKATVLRWVARGDLPYVYKLPGPAGVVLFDARIVQRKAAERLIEQMQKRSA